MLACAVAAFLGVAVIASFASLLDTGLADGVSDADAEALVTMASVVGAWGLVIVLFSIASTVGVVVRRRAGELAALRTLSATPRQVRALVRRETVAVTAIAGAAGLLPGWAGGAVLERMLEEGGLVSASVDHRFSPVTALTVLAGVVLVSVVAGSVAARPATRGSALGVDADDERATIGRVRAVVGVLLMAAGASGSVMAFVLRDVDDPYAVMQAVGPSSIAWSMGFALLSPVLLRSAAGVVGRVVPGGLATSMAVAHARNRAVRTSRTLMPLIVFVGVSVGTLYLMAIDAEAMGDDVDEVVRLLNFVVVGMIAAFAAIMVVNTTIAATADRRRELGRQRVLGATGGDVVGVLVAESVLCLAVATVLGLVASLGTVVPYALVKTDTVVPAGGPWPLVGVLAVAALVGVGTTWASARRAVAVPPLEAVA